MGKEELKVEENITKTHDLRRQADQLIQDIEAEQDAYPGRALSIAHTNAQQTKMWLGKRLEELGSELPKEYQDKA